MNVNDTSVNACASFHESLALLASGALAGAEVALVETHLARCPACRAQHAAFASLASKLREAGTVAPEIVPSAAMQAQWARAITTHRPAPLASGLAIWIRDFLPGPRPAWAGLATVWLLILFFRVNSPEVASSTPRVAVAATAQQILTLLRTNQTLYSELRELPPPRVIRPPAVPRPRSERNRPFLSA